jgi:hypothetical protein
LYNKNKKLLHTYPAGKTETSFSIPNGVASIGDIAFSFCSSLASVTIPDSVTSIGDSVFWDCSSLTSVTFLGTITSSNFCTDKDTFPGDLRDMFYATNKTNGTPGTYTRAKDSETWTRK